MNASHALVLRPRPPQWVRSVLAGATALVFLAVGCGSRTELQPGRPGPGPAADLEPPPEGGTNKADILFVIDNSGSMAPHQNYMADAAVDFMRKLASPDCVSSSGRRVPSNQEDCPDGFELEFSPLDDFHIGVISSSLGGHGGEGCESDPAQNDGARLIPRVRTGVDDPTGLGFLRYDGNLGSLPGLEQTLRLQMDAVGERGCGLEAQLESMYRFLIDPAPPERVVLQDGGSTPVGLDEELLAQRRAFLRDDSAVFILLLSDEDDCSVLDGGDYYPNASAGWLLADDDRFAQTLAPGTPICAEDPNSRCCFSCLSAEAPLGCEDQLAACPEERLAPEFDQPNLRCFDQKRRFGLDLLYPVERYVQGLTSPEIIDARTGELVLNPLLVTEDERRLRSPDWVFLTVVAGVPWQDLATDFSLRDPDGLTLLGHAELAEPAVPVAGTLRTRWELMIGDPSTGTPPFDPFMVESIAPRSGSHPLEIDGRSIARIVGPQQMGGNAINGHELGQFSGGQPLNDLLQPACLYSLGDAAIDCEQETARGCACQDQLDRELPVCKAEPRAELPATTTQFHANAWPAPRLLQVVRGLGRRGVAGSICPKIQEPTSFDFGYRPVTRELSSRLPGVLR